MRRIYNYFRRDEKGFTLVELLIVVIILAVISGIAVPSYLALRNRARESATENEMRNIATAVEMYAADNNGSYPTSADATALASDISAYMDNMPTADAWGTTYQYTSADADGSSYTLESYGVDKDIDGGDNIVLTDGSFTETGSY